MYNIPYTTNCQASKLPWGLWERVVARAGSDIYLDVRKAMKYSQCVELTFWSRGPLEGK